MAAGGLNARSKLRAGNARFDLRAGPAGTRVRALHGSDRRAPGAPAFLSFLMLPGGEETPPPTLGFLDAWKQPGVFLFSLQPLTGTPSTLAQHLGLTPPHDTTHGIAWITLESIASLTFTIVRLLWMSEKIGQVGPSDGVLPFGNIQLLLPSQTTVGFTPSPPAAVFTGSGIHLQRNDGQGTPVQPDDFQVILSFDPSSPGGYTFTANWDTLQSVRALCR